MLRKWVLGVALACAFSGYAINQTAAAAGDIDLSGGNGTYKGVAKQRSRVAKKPPKPTPKRPTSPKPKSTSAVKPKPTPATPAKPFNEDIWTYRRNCFAMTQGCPPKTVPALTKRPAASTPNPRTVVRRVVARLQLPDPTPRFGPDPNLNEWKMAAVGFPIWLWTDGPTTVRTTATRSGLTFDLTATWVSTTFAMGDGKKLTCTKTTRFDPSRPAGSKSPTCGHQYSQPSPKGHPYQLSATTNWRITWAALGQNGTINATHTGTTTLNVGELNAIIVG